MRARVFICAAIALCTAAPSQAVTRADRNKALHLNLVLATGVCSERFGFTPALPVSGDEKIGSMAARTEKEMVAKIDAYWLLKGSYEVTDDDPAWSTWYRQIAKPIVALMQNKDALPGERDAAAAAVAASLDPSVYDEAKARFMEKAMQSSNAALDGCRTGAADPFIGKHYWSGQSSDAKVRQIEQEFSDYFAELVASLKKKP